MGLSINILKPKKKKKKKSFTEVNCKMSEKKGKKFDLYFPKPQKKILKRVMSYLKLFKIKEKIQIIMFVNWVAINFWLGCFILVNFKLFS